MDIPPQGVITQDNVTITIDTVVFYQITDPAKAVYEIQSLKKGIEYLAITTIRDIVGKMSLDETFSSRDLINQKLRSILDEATDKWGCKIDRVEIKDINPPEDIRDAMEKQMNAERNKRALILQSEGQRQSAITLAEGKKAAAILEAEADKVAQIRRDWSFTISFNFLFYIVNFKSLNFSCSIIIIFYILFNFLRFLVCSTCIFY